MWLEPSFIFHPERSTDELPALNTSTHSRLSSAPISLETSYMISEMTTCPSATVGTDRIKKPGRLARAAIAIDDLSLMVLATVQDALELLVRHFARRFFRAPPRRERGGGADCGGFALVRARHLLTHRIHGALRRVFRRAGRAVRRFPGELLAKDVGGRSHPAPLPPRRRPRGPRPEERRP